MARGTKGRKHRDPERASKAGGLPYVQQAWAQRFAAQAAVRARLAPGEGVHLHHAVLEQGEESRVTPEEAETQDGLGGGRKVAV